MISSCVELSHRISPLTSVGSGPRFVRLSSKEASIKVSFALATTSR
jgi:hypothetical protein